MGKQWKQCQTLFFWAPKSLQMVTAAMKLKDACLYVNIYTAHREERTQKVKIHNATQHTAIQQ